MSIMNSYDFTAKWEKNRLSKIIANRFGIDIKNKLIAWIPKFYIEAADVGFS